MTRLEEMTVELHRLERELLKLKCEQASTKAILKVMEAKRKIVLKMGKAAKS